MRSVLYVVLFLLTMEMFLSACLTSENGPQTLEAVESGSISGMTTSDRIAQYTPLRLQYPVNSLRDSQRQMVFLLMEAAKLMDDIFWKQAYGDRDSLLSLATEDPLKQLLLINYGPYDRLNGNEPFIKRVPPKSAGANFYPANMSREEFVSSSLVHKKDMFTLLVRQENGRLATAFYHEAYAEEHQRVAELLHEAATYAESEDFRQYLELRAEDFMGSDYLASNFAWLKSRDSQIELIIGPIESYEDKLFGYKAAHQALLLVKDTAMSRELSRFAQFLPMLQARLPIDDSYQLGRSFDKDAEFNAYDALYAGGLFNAGSKTMALNVPHASQRLPGQAARRMLLKNIIRAKFDHILHPIGNILVDASQVSYVSYEAFFTNTLFHEMAQDLGVQSLRSGPGSVYDALQEYASTIDEGKADILGLYMAAILMDEGELPRTSLEELYTTYLASLFRSMRFGRSDAHGKANMLAFQHLMGEKALIRTAETGTYRVDFPQMRIAIESLSRKYLTLQGDGNYNEVSRWVEEEAKITPELAADLARLQIAGVPVDLVFEQGPEVIGE